ncbi:unnamed protein product, partial [Ectocarpus fasciculatus]
GKWWHSSVGGDGSCGGRAPVSTTDHAASIDGVLGVRGGADRRDRAEESGADRARAACSARALQAPAGGGNVPDLLRGEGRHGAPPDRLPPLLPAGPGHPALPRPAVANSPALRRRGPRWRWWRSRTRPAVLLARRTRVVGHAAAR